MCNKKIFIVSLAMLSLPVAADTIDSLRQYDEAFKKAIEEAGPYQVVVDNAAAFNYILKHYVIQGRAIVEAGAVPKSFNWKCSDQVTHCVDHGMKCQLPAALYKSEEEQSQCN